MPAQLFLLAISDFGPIPESRATILGFLAWLK